MFFLDLFKAFDRVWHEKLVFKLKWSDICGTYTGIIRSFLTKKAIKKLFLTGSLQTGQKLKLVFGKAQGSLFFLVYTNDLLCSLNLNATLFEDDASRFSVSCDPSVTAETNTR